MLKILNNNERIVKTMAAHIEKIARIGGTKVYYQGNLKWTDQYSDRKVYNTNEDAQEDLYQFAGTVVTE